MAEFSERFAELREDTWLPAYLPAWSSRAAAAATYRTEPEGLVLSIPADQPRWCPGLHDDPPLRVSAVQSGNWSGSVGSTFGQQPFRPGLVVAEEQPTLYGMVVHHGRVEVECRATIDDASMFSAWMIGMEDSPERCGEICLVEVFGRAVTTTDAGVLAEIGSGVHAFRDPELSEEFSADARLFDPARWHTYTVDWRPDGIDWLVDGEPARTSTQSPGYPMLLILGVFDFPADRDSTSPTGFVPELHVRRVRVDGHLVTAPG